MMAKPTLLVVNTLFWIVIIVAVAVCAEKSTLWDFFESDVYKTVIW